MTLNKVMLIGNVTRDPETRTLPNGELRATTGLAVDRSWVDKEGKKQSAITFFNLVATRKVAEILAKYVRKASRLFVDGRLDATTVTNDRGETRTFHHVVVQGLQLLDHKTQKAA